ncbi:unnamed protein product [marine sediment metagenome]|uniref:Uncharacterized protein n=1 Tax=marine sediment metagenome TaxID=412755 RepID=X1QF27_9ZZZZ
MKIEDLITELQKCFDEADLALDAGHPHKAREYLRLAKELLDDKFAAD